MAKKTTNRGKNGLSGETRIIELPFNDENYDLPLFVGLNGMNWIIKRGEPVEVPVEVADIVKRQITQDRNTAMLKKNLSAQNQTALATM